MREEELPAGSICLNCSCRRRIIITTVIVIVIAVRTAVLLFEGVKTLLIKFPTPLLFEGWDEKVRTGAELLVAGCPG